MRLIKTRKDYRAIAYINFDISFLLIVSRILAPEANPGYASKF